MNTIININNNANSVRVHNHNKQYSKTDLLAYAQNINKAKFADIRFNRGYSVLSHEITGKSVKIAHKTPTKYVYKIHVDRSIDDCGIGYDWEISENDFYKNIIVPGGRDFRTINTGDFAALYNVIVNNCIEYDALLYELEDIAQGVKDRDYRTMCEAITDILGVSCNRQQAGAVRKALNTPTSTYYLTYRNDNDVIVEILTALTPHTWKREAIKGCCQGDYAEIIYPADVYNDDDLKRFEAFFFGMYYDYAITYKGDTITDFIPDYIAWDSEKMDNYILDLVSANNYPDDVKRPDIVYMYD